MGAAAGKMEIALIVRPCPHTCNLTAFKSRRTGPDVEVVALVLLPACGGVHGGLEAGFIEVRLIHQDQRLDADKNLYTATVSPVPPTDPHTHTTHVASQTAL